jgi:16S rRNA (guanine966-N2)-methyltransferase
VRIVGGEWGGKALATPKGDKTRPTTDGNRESVFNILAHGVGHEPARVLDLFAGSGGLGFEALSRGAQRLVSVEEDRAACACIRKNAENFGLGPDRFALLSSGRLSEWGRSLSSKFADFGPFDTVFCDPPYDQELPRRALEALEKHPKLFAPGACLFVETSTREKTPELPGWKLANERSRGTTRLLFYRRGE